MAYLVFTDDNGYLNLKIAKVNGQEKTYYYVLLIFKVQKALLPKTTDEHNLCQKLDWLISNKKVIALIILLNSVFWRLY